MGKKQGAKRSRAGAASRGGTPARAAAVKGPRQAPRWLRWFALGLLLCVHAFLLAGVFNPTPHPGGDNAGYLTLAYSLLENGEYTDLYDPSEPAHTKYPPGFALVLAGAMLLGARTWAQFKVISALAIFATVGLSVAWVWRRKGWELAITTGAVLAFANAFLYASQWILSDPLLLVLTMAALVAFDASETDDGVNNAWLALGIAVTVAAFFTRSAGLPLVVAAGLWLLWRRRLVAAGAFSVCLGIPAVLWWLRDRRLGGAGYTGEFWMINPYEPALGRAGPLDLVGRITGNATGYFTAHIPTGFVGSRASIVAVLGIGLLALAATGWVRRMRTPGVAELFAPLYLGLILLWPEVWSGDRFALPLFPLLVFYAGETLLWATGPLPKSGRVAVLAAALALMLVPSAVAWNRSATQAESCRMAQRTQGAFACSGPAMQEFIAAAEWSGASLGDGAVVVSRKPRWFFVASGTASQIFPLSSEPDVFLSAAESMGAEHVVIDRLDNLTRRYLIPILQQRSSAFCTTKSFGTNGIAGATELLGILTQGTEASGAGEPGSISLLRCPPALMGTDRPQMSSSSTVVPLLVGLDS